ncbi:hypothetical protein DIPPA_21596 [Diplonema papillatum]|nr:hypothetical protein DIPPA_21596 [Diplonema papillatum]
MAPCSIPLRGVNLMLVFLCVVITAMLCTLLSLQSADDALTKTEEARNRVTNATKAAISRTGDQLKDSMIDRLLKMTEDEVLNVLTRNRLITESLLSVYSAQPSATLRSWEWQWSQRTWLLTFYDKYKSLGTKEIAVHSIKNMTIVYGQRKVGSISVNTVTWNNGTDYDTEAGLPAKDRYRYAAPAYPSGNPSMEMPTGIYPDCSVERSGSLLAIQPCQFSLPPAAFPTPASSYSASWSPLEPMGDFVGITCSTYYHSNDAYELIGVVSSTVSTEQFANIFFRLQLARRWRVFVSVAEHQNADAYQNHLVGVSHGKASFVDDEGNAYPRHVHNASDPLISRVARWITTVSNSTTGLDGFAFFEDFGKPYSFEMSEIDNGYVDKWYLQVSRIADYQGTDWYCSVLVDHDSVLGAVDRQFAESEAFVVKVDVDVQKDLDNSRDVIYVSIAAAAFGMLALSAVLVFKITAPILQLQKEMDYVARMKLENVDTKRSLSGLTEVRQMQTCFLEMLSNLKLFREFVPATVLVDSESEEEDDTLTRTAPDGSCKDSAGRSHHSGKAGGGQKRSFDTASRKQHTAGRSVSSSNGQQSSESGAGVAFASTEIKNKDAAFACVNIKNFLQLGKEGQVSLLQKTVAMVAFAARDARGIIDAFVGDRILVLWNVVRVVPSHRLCATRFAVRVAAPHGAELSVGVAAGPVKCGNMGAEGVKKMNFLGAAHGWALCLERLARWHDGKVFTDSKVQHDISAYFLTRAIDVVTFLKVKKAPVVVYEVTGEKSVAEEEWMYQLKEGEDQDLNAAWNEALRFYASGQWDAALDKLRQVGPASKRGDDFEARIREAKECPETPPKSLCTYPYLALC